MGKYRVQRKGTKHCPEGMDMPQYLARENNTYYFRQAVPAELRPLLGRREIKQSLGHNYEQAVRACKRYTVEADNLLANARAKLDAASPAPFSRDNIRRTQSAVLTSLTREAFEEYGQHIEAGLQALRRQQAMGDVLPMMIPAKLFLMARGYEPHLSEDEWRRLAYTQANLEDYEAMATRQAGQESNPDETPRWRANTSFSMTNACTAKTTVTWNALFETWAEECERRAKQQPVRRVPAPPPLRRYQDQGKQARKGRQEAVAVRG